MQKISIVLVVALGFMIYGMLSFAGASKNYWQSVGPQWDQMLNPCSYSNCQTD